MRLGKIKDRITLGVLAGVIGGVPWRLLNTWEYHHGVVDYRWGQLAASFFTRNPKDVDKPTLAMNGRIANQLILAFTGVGITYILSATGREKAVLKGAGVGASLWLGVFGLTQRTGMATARTASSTLRSFIDHIGLGATVAALITAFGHESVFPSINQQNIIGGITDTASSHRQDSLHQSAPLAEHPR